MTDPLSPRYDDLLAAVGRAHERIGGRDLTSHWPLVGGAYDRGVLVVGQAVFGWIPTWKAADATTDDRRAALLADTREVFADRADPMSWISGHRVHNTPFWRTAHEVVDALTPGPAPWYSRLAWANLYPIAPNDAAGNPEGVLREVQTGPAARFLDAVVEALDPLLVLVLAGPIVWPFVEPLGLGGLDRAEPPFTVVGRRQGRPWIAGMHPGGAQRRGWPARRYGELIVAKAVELGAQVA